LDYPLVLEELKIEQNKIKTLESIIVDEREKLSIYKSILNNKELQIKNFEEQKKEYEKQLNKSKSGFYLYGKAPLSAQDFTPEVGIQLNIKNKMFVSGGIQYNNLNNNVNVLIGIGVKLF
jgi:hypothetical protein